MQTNRDGPYSRRRLMMNTTLRFSDFSILDRKYYIADFFLDKTGGNDFHSHDFYEFFVVLEGQFQEQVNGRSFLLPSRFVHFLRPGDSHRLLSSGQYEANTLRNIAVEKHFFESLLYQSGVSDASALFAPFQIDGSLFQTYLSKTEALSLLSQEEAGKHFIISGILHDLMIEALLDRKAPVSAPDWLQNACRQISCGQNYKKGLPYFIELSGKTQEHLSRELKKHYGVTPTRFLNRLRLEAAASMLCTSNEKIIDIVYECGFDNISYFNRLFLEQFGVSPRQYRDKNKNFFNISI